MRVIRLFLKNLAFFIMRNKFKQETVYFSETQWEPEPGQFYYDVKLSKATLDSRTVDSYGWGYLVCRERDEMKSFYMYEQKIRIKDLDSFNIVINYKDDVYFDINSFLLHKVFGLKSKAVKSATIPWVSKEDVLNLLVSRYSCGERFIWLDIFNASRGGWINHKWFNPLYAGKNESRITGYLDALIETGELEKVDGSFYVLTPKAITTLDEYEKSNKIHNENTRLQWILIFLTGLSFVGALIQAYASLAASGKAWWP